jgi:hypothetical protein
MKAVFCGILGFQWTLSEVLQTRFLCNEAGKNDFVNF